MIYTQPHTMSGVFQMALTIHNAWAKMANGINTVKKAYPKRQLGTNKMFACSIIEDKKIP
jgi:hypothetical protein